MLDYVVKQWDENKHLLEDYFKTTEQGEYNSYKNILSKIYELVVTEKGYSKMKHDAITTIDDGHYQGTLIFITPTDRYQPFISDYIITHVSYGSCSGCDTLEAIHNYSSGLPNEEQVRDYMMLALHLIQNMRELKD